MNLTTEEKIKNLLALKDEIDKQISDLMLKQKEEKWQPKGGDYYIQMNGKVYSFAKPQQAEIDFGMAFETRQAAEKATKAYRKYHRLYKLAEELNPEGWEPDWTNRDQEKVGLSKTCEKTQTTVWYESQIVGAVYFASRKIAAQAVKILEQEE